jgi:hypothetical protein
VAEVVGAGVVPVYDWVGADASARYREASRLLETLPIEEISKVSPLLDRERVQEKALAGLMEALVERRLHGVVTPERIEANPWSLISSELKGAEPELLRRVQDVAMGLVLDAWERRDGSDTREEAWLWNRYADAARSVYAEAECELALVSGIEREGPKAVQHIGRENRGEVAAAREQDRAVLFDMVGEASYRAVNDPVPRDADAAALLQISDDLDAALDRLDAVRRAGGATGISPQYIAEQFEKAGVRQEEIEARLEEMDWEIDRHLPTRVSTGELEVSGSERVYEDGPALARDENGPGRDGGDGRSR